MSEDEKQTPHRVPPVAANPHYAKLYWQRVAAEMHYISAIPDTLPDGEVLVHNDVRPSRRPGNRGFRAWTQARRPMFLLGRLERCDCDWAGVDLHSLTHYRSPRPLG